ncbi:hypothetical protein BC829DRAFT_385550 [Chytridium lagenaria]|nr:hypothetical protein BC829DRAFT_385550 [Chytridium lagenaria]
MGSYRYKIYAKGVSVCDQGVFKRLAQSTEGFTGADIRELFRRASKSAQKDSRTEVKESDLEQAVAEIKANLKT